MTQKDTIFANASPKVEDFNFDEAVADVFPDMINRSVPGYADIIRAAGRIAQRFVTKQSKVYDIGCSLGATSLSISRALPANHCEITAIDTAQAMVDRCKRIVAQYALPNAINVLNADANNLSITNASLVCMNFVLQFIPREKRQTLVNNIAAGLNSGGVFMLSEKIQSSSELSNQLLIELHHDYKRDNGYSELEIAQKRAALENVMLTDTLKTHEERLLSAGFSQVTVWYQHYNFVSLLAVK
ncbi:carboxy-S-adenosyl-L-methionine synthase CmoA [Alteromonas sp. 5E99-2]|uniref:carboxy-S-adenosyl-L-methionine synthase CmoA n=1 Tax=Alteromonas sp. 5E99-2 TaxID=2817683 RepID=UPI001A99BE65|nr:carboxy-S-adenosyl-L-methionine synthase CmoA [Alteromonas sp. 5E99-2]